MKAPPRFDARRVQRLARLRASWWRTVNQLELFRFIPSRHQVPVVSRIAAELAEALAEVLGEALEERS